MSNPPLFLPKKRKIAESKLTFLLGNCPLRFLAISFRLACNRNLPNPMRHFEQLVQILADTDELPIFRRDAAADLGDLGDPRAIPLLIDALADASALVRREAAKALGKLNDPRGTARLLLALAKETDEMTCCSVIETLGRIGTRDALPALTAMLESDFRIIQTEARKGIRQIQGRYPDILKPDVAPDKPTVPITLPQQQKIKADSPPRLLLSSAKRNDSQSATAEVSIPTDRTQDKRSHYERYFVLSLILIAAVIAGAIYVHWTLDKMNGFWGRKRENGTEKGTRHCFAPRLRGWIDYTMSKTTPQPRKRGVNPYCLVLNNGRSPQ